MNTAASKKIPNQQPADVELHNGDCMTQKDFHRLYEQTPEDFRAELIEGIVYVASPLKNRHGTAHVDVACLLRAYGAATPGLEATDAATVIMSELDEVQPDLLLRRTSNNAGNSVENREGYLEGAPEFVCEIALSSRAIDLHKKKERYARAGVIEYMVFCLKPLELRIFNLQSSIELKPEADGIFRSLIFPGLWINVPAVLSSNYDQFMDTLQQGIESEEHAKFIAMLG